MASHTNGALLASSSERLTTALADRYRIERELGQGGMATVYLAHDLRHERDVAIKVLHPDLGAALGSERFLSEIKTTAKLQHPHILPLLDSGDAGGLLYYVMPLATGETLRARLERERQLPIEDAVQIAREVADALGYAHGFGVIHRDIKPENILLQGGHALVADFGIALAVQQAGGQRMTQTGLSLGTPQYMSPEQAMGERAIDARTDIYALGAVSYEMLVGTPPFTGATTQAIVAKVMSERPSPISTVRDTVPPGIEAAVLKALAKLPADRWRSANEFAEALEGRRTDGQTVGRAVTRPSDRPSVRPSVLIPALFLAMGLGAGLLIARGRNALEIGTGRITRVTVEDGLEVQPAISPDGKMMVYAAGTSLYVRLFLRPVDGGRAVPLTSEAPGVQEGPRWSPSGSSILFRSNGGVDTVAVGLGGGTPVTLINRALGPVSSATWSPDGREIAFVRRDSLLIYTIANGATRFVAKQPARECNWSPSGKHIVCSVPRDFGAIGANMGNTGPSTLTVVAVNGGALIGLTDSTSLYASPVWAPDGRRLYFISNRDGQRDIYYLNIGEDGHADGGMHRVTTALSAASLSLSGDGRRLAYSVYTPQANVWSLPILTNGVATPAMATQVTFGHQLVESMAVTPDGKTLVFDADRNGNSDIWRLTIGEREAQAMTSDPTDEFGGELSPDGRRLAYYSYPEGTLRGAIWVKPLDGGPVQHVNGSESYGIFPEWSPDGSTLTWACGAAGSLRIPGTLQGPKSCTATQDGGGKWHVEVKQERLASWSPDGRWSTNHRRNGTFPGLGADSIWISPRGPGERRLLYVRPPSEPRATGLQWGADSRALYFRSTDSTGRVSFWRLSVDGGPPRLVARLDDLTRPSYRIDFATDGRRLYFSINDRQSDISVVELIER